MPPPSTYPQIRPTPPLPSSSLADVSMYATWNVPSKKWYEGKEQGYPRGSIFCKGVFQRRTPTERRLFTFLSSGFAKIFSWIVFTSVKKLRTQILQRQVILKGKSPHLRLKCVVEKRLCLSSLVNFHHEHSIVPANCPWVSEDGAGLERWNARMVERRKNYPHSKTRKKKKKGKEKK